MKRIACFFFIVLIALACKNALHAQNLVINPGFEIHPGFPDRVTNSPTIKAITIPGWTDPTEGTSDLYIWGPEKTENSITPVPDSGNAYGGFWGSDQGKGEGEYMQGTLSMPLKAGVTYRFSISIWIDIGLYGNENDINSFEVSFSDSSRKNLGGLAQSIELKSQIKLSTSKRIQRTGRWDVYQMDYTARGGERYFILGTFRDRGVKVSSDYVTPTYFYIDNVSLVSEEELGPIPPGY
ncbi:MAG TPA: hypothetical protein VL651_04245 [Bacteroidia bacterium]|nr:hypothetical protein [Bacteroidia bacterium]